MRRPRRSRVPGLAAPDRNAAEFYRSVCGLVDPRRLSRKRVAVVGLGSGGGRVAAELGRLGVQLLLVERPRERIEEHNIVRHLLGYSSLGKPKLGEMAAYLANLNPAGQVKLCALDVVEQQDQFAAGLARWAPDVIAVCTDNEPSKHALNEVALRLRVPLTGGAVYDGGIGGEIYRVRPGQACYGCLATQLRLERQVPAAGRARDYTNPAANENHTTSALNLDIGQIALLQSRLTLQFLLEPEADLVGLPAEVNLCVFANRRVQGVFARPWHCEFFSIARRADCLSCGQPVDAPTGTTVRTTGVSLARRVEGSG